MKQIIRMVIGFVLVVVGGLMVPQDIWNWPSFLGFVLRVPVKAWIVLFSGLAIFIMEVEELK